MGHLHKANADLKTTDEQKISDQWPFTTEKVGEDTEQDLVYKHLLAGHLSLGEI